MKTLTARQWEVLNHIRAYIAGHGYSPSIRDLAEAMNIRSTHGVHCHLDALERKGFVARDRRVARSIRIIERPDGG